MTMDDPVRSFLGLDADDPLVPVAVDEAPPVRPRALQRGPVAALLDQHPQRLPILRELGIRAWRSTWAPDVVLLETGSLTARAGAVEELERLVVLDGRDGAAMVRWLDAPGERALVNERGRVRVFDVGSPALAALGARAEEPATLAAPLPSASELLGTDAGWLHERVEALRAARSPALAAAAVGLAGRLAPDPAPARAWAEALRAADREGIVADALRQLGALSERLERLSDDARRGLDPTPTLVELVDLRDVLASAAWVVRPPAPALEEALRELDREVEARWSELPPLPRELAALCEEVAWREPWAWWGRLAGEWP